MAIKMTRQVKNQGRQRGFTMLEVIAVIVIVAILLAVAVSRVVSTQNISALTEADSFD